MNDLWKPLPWQQQLWLELTAQALSGRLHHALLLAGPEGVGKRHFARALAAFLLCEQRSGYACGQCRSCQQLAAGTLANAVQLSVDGNLALCLGPRPEQSLVHWEPDKDSKRKDIGIEAVRSFISQISLAGHYGQGRVALIDPAEKLNQNSVNAFLKTIEEPPAGTYLLLISEQPALLKPTLRSRCQRLLFAVPERGQSLAWLQAQGANDALALLESAHGAPLRALEWLRAQRPQQHQQWREWLHRLAEHKSDPLSVAADIGKADAQQFLSWFAGWLTTLLRENLVGGTQPVALARFATTLTESQRRLDGNAKPELVLDALMIQWWSLHKSRRSTEWHRANG